MSSWASWHPGGAFMRTTRWGGKLITFFIDPVFIAGNTTATAVECRWRPCAVSIRTLQGGGMFVAHASQACARRLATSVRCRRWRIGLP